jgi:glycosyltransferase involved in cell wall biosynthesis
MQGGAVTLARRFLTEGCAPDLILATDMLDLTTFLALTKQKTAGLPVAVYFHENQLTYPWSPNDRDPGQQRDVHYGFINYTSALAADGVLFNSAYHKTAFLGELPGFLGSFPDHNERSSVMAIAEKSQVLPLGLDLQRLDRLRPETTAERSRVPLILWNHRWEYDKNPDEFFHLLLKLDAEGLDFEVAVLGEAYRSRPAIFEEARQRLGCKLIHFGYVENFEEYAAWLWRADILPVHAIHDFFGASVVQAIYCGVLPMLPYRLAYPEHCPDALQADFYYRDINDLLERMRWLLRSGNMTVRPTDLREHVARYDWAKMAPVYDSMLENIAARTWPAGG